MKLFIFTKNDCNYTVIAENQKDAFDKISDDMNEIDNFYESSEYGLDDKEKWEINEYDISEGIKYKNIIPQDWYKEHDENY